ncbi:hypothetical protein L3X38_029078 [Prunus dulcis]|uniref:Uncharacterized protein n=1 Tax=Prunus dulcis TaxID=3755 RepID=A0AAD4VRX7_PRUDU|nr:hypothetical protein L3X38_029078 [Prunus dulcis]
MAKPKNSKRYKNPARLPAKVLTPFPSFDLGNKIRSSLSTKEACRLQLRTYGATIAKMIVPSIKDDCLMVRDNVVLSHVPRNISVAPAADEAAFIGASSSNSSLKHLLFFKE